MRPRGRPPTPSARSRPSEPVEIVSISTARSRWPRRMTEPLPKARSICPIAASRARCRSGDSRRNALASSAMSIRPRCSLCRSRLIPRRSPGWKRWLKIAPAFRLSGRHFPRACRAVFRSARPSVFHAAATTRAQPFPVRSIDRLPARKAARCQAWGAKPRRASPAEDVVKSRGDSNGHPISLYNFISSDINKPTGVPASVKSARSTGRRPQRARSISA